jgi:hypothetical protein
MVMKKKVVVEVSLLLNYEDRKKFADFFAILVVADRRQAQHSLGEAGRVQASKKKVKKKKTVQVKARDPTSLKLRRTGPCGLFLYVNTKKDPVNNRALLFCKQAIARLMLF